MAESNVVKEWLGLGEKGKVMGKVEAVLELLNARLGPVQPDLAASIRTIEDLAVLRRLLLSAAQVLTFDEFRQETGL